MSSAAPDPWSINYFDPPTPHVPAPSPKPKVPKLVPEIDRLFAIQRDALIVLNALEDLAKLLHHHDDRHVQSVLQTAGHGAENSYRSIRSYLADYSTGS